MLRPRHLLAPICALALATPRLQAGDFTTGDLFLFSPAITGISSVDGAIVRVDPLSGNASMLLDTWSTPSRFGSMAWDPYREGLLFCAGLDSVSQPLHLWLVDGAGGRTDLGQVGLTLYALAPTPFGFVYLEQDGFVADHVRYLDQFNVLHTLLDDAGSAPFDLVPGGSGTIQALIYHAGTHSLFTASGSNLAPVCGGGPNSTAISIRRVPLSLDGTQSAGTVACAEFEVSSSGETATQWSLGPGGTLLLFVDTNSNAAESRMLQVDPVTMAVGAYATNGSYTGAAATNAGTYSNLLGKTVILDTFLDALRAYGAGESGAGQVITTSFPVSAGGSSGETATLVEAQGSGCDGQYTVYGAGLAGSGGFVPTLAGTNCPEIGKAITLEIAKVRGGAIGALLLGTTQASLPFKGGQLLVAPILVTLNLLVGGTPGAAGAGSLSLPVLLPNDAGWVGLSIDCQAAFADPNAVKGASLTAGLEIDVG